MSSFHDKRFPGESDEYRSARDELIRAELDLRRRIEDVAAQRRELPLGGALKEDYVFEEMRDGELRSVAFSELFAPGKDSLLLYNYMFGADWEKPCPMCTSFLDGLDANAAYVRERVSLAVVARQSAERLRAWGDERGWRRLPLLSSGKSTFNTDYHAEFPSEYGDQHPVMHVFTKEDGEIHHRWSSEVVYVEGDGQPRHLDLVWPIWNLFDLTPEGRGTDWYPDFQR